MPLRAATKSVPQSLHAGVTKTGGHMALGIDTALNLNNNVPCTVASRPSTCRNWQVFTTWWNEKTPAYAGRYFGSSWDPPPPTIQWVPGELSNLPAPIDQNLKFIVPLCASGRSTGSEIRPGFPDGVQVYGRQEGTGFNNVTNYQHGLTDGYTTCQKIVEALEYKYDASLYELDLPPGRQVIVFLDVEPQTILNAYYWAGWGFAVQMFTFTLERNGVTETVQPFLPGLYCWFDQNGPRPTVLGALRQKVHINGDVWAMEVYGFITPAQELIDENPSPGPLDENQVVQLLNSLFGGNGFATFRNVATKLAASVVIWQYKINIGFDETGKYWSERDVDNLPSCNDHPPPCIDQNGNGPVKYDFDISVTNPNGYSGKPITDFMLWRSPNVP
jgi:hypothetical protein